MLRPTPLTTLAATAALLLGLVLVWVGIEAWLGRRAWARSLAVRKTAREPARGPFGLFLVPAAGLYCLAAGFLIPSPFTVPVLALAAASGAVLAGFGALVIFGPRTAAALAPSWARPTILGDPVPPPLPSDAVAERFARALQARLEHQASSQVLACFSPLGTVVVTGGNDDFTVAVLGAGKWRPDAWWHDEGFRKFGHYDGWRADQLGAAAASASVVAALRRTGATWRQIRLSACVGRLQLHQGRGGELRALMAQAPGVDTVDLQRALDQASR